MSISRATTRSNPYRMGIAASLNEDEHIDVYANLLLDDLAFVGKYRFVDELGTDHGWWDCTDADVNTGLGTWVKRSLSQQPSDVVTVLTGADAPAADAGQPGFFYIRFDGRLYAKTVDGWQSRGKLVISGTGTVTTGSTGQTFYYGTINPTGNTALPAGLPNGVVYLNTTTYDQYVLASGEWTFLANIKGANGTNGTNGTNGINGTNGTNGRDGKNGAPGEDGLSIQGPKGDPGQNGATILTGAGNPGSADGNVGDLYINSTTGDYFTKTTGTPAWVQRGSLGAGSPGTATGVTSFNGRVGSITLSTPDVLSVVNSANQLAGGLHSILTVSQMVALPPALRDYGMRMTVYGDTAAANGRYDLANDLITWIRAGSDATGQFAVYTPSGLYNAQSAYVTYADPDTGALRIFHSLATGAATTQPAPLNAFNSVSASWEEISPSAVSSTAPLYFVTGQNTNGAMTQKAVTDELILKAGLISPAFIGNPTAPTPSFFDNDNSIATSSFVQQAISGGTTMGVTVKGTGESLTGLALGAINNAAGGYMLATQGYTNNQLTIYANAVLDLNYNTFTVLAYGFHIYGGVKILRNGMMKGPFFLRSGVPGQTVTITGGVIQGRINADADYTGTPLILDGVTVLSDGSGTDATTGAAQIIMRNGSKFYGCVPGPGAIITYEPVSSLDTFSILPYAASIAIDFDAASVRTLAATGNVAFTAAVNIALLKMKELNIINTLNVPINLSFPPAWKFFPGPAPTTLAANKEAILTLRSLGTTDSTIKAAYVAQVNGGA